MAFDSVLYAAKYVIIGKQNSEGYFVGQVADANNIDASVSVVSSGGLVLNTAVSITPPAITRNIVTEFDGMEIKQVIDTGVSDIATGTFVLGRANSLLNTLASGVGINTAQTSSYEQGGTDIAPVTLYNVIIGFVGNASNNNGTTFTKGLFQIDWYFGCTLTNQPPEKNQSGGQNPSPLTWTFAPTKSTTHFTGQAFSAISGLNYAASGVLMHQFNKGVYPPAVQMFKMNGVATTATLAYLPISSAFALSGANLVCINGVPTAVTSINIVTGLVTFAAAPAANAIVVIVYPSNYLTA